MMKKKENEQKNEETNIITLVPKFYIHTYKYIDIYIYIIIYLSYIIMNYIFVL